MQHIIMQHICWLLVPAIILKTLIDIWFWPPDITINYYLFVSLEHNVHNAIEPTWETSNDSVSLSSVRAVTAMWLRPSQQIPLIVSTMSPTDSPAWSALLSGRIWQNRTSKINNQVRSSERSIYGSIYHFSHSLVFWLAVHRLILLPPEVEFCSQSQYYFRRK